MAATTFDQNRSDAFAERTGRMLNDAALVLMMSIGHQTGLFQVMAGMSLATSEQIAQAATLQERYVREWLGAMVTGRIVDYDATTAMYQLPSEHAAWLTLAAGPANVALDMQLVPILAQVEDRIVDCFRNGGGVSYTAYSHFHTWGAESTKARVDTLLIGTVIPLLPRLQDQLESGIDVADIGCGSGHAMIVPAQAFPQSRFTGYDFSGEAIAAARAEARQLGLSNVRFEVKDVATLDCVAAFDVITAFDAIHDQAQPRQVLLHIFEALRLEGMFLMIDIAAATDLGANIDHPAGPFLYTVSCMHCMTVSLAHGGEGLGAVWGKQQARQLLAEAGFAQVEVKIVSEDAFNYYYVATK